MRPNRLHELISAKQTGLVGCLFWPTITACAWPNGIAKRPTEDLAEAHERVALQVASTYLDVLRLCQRLAAVGSIGGHRLVMRGLVSVRVDGCPSLRPGRVIADKMLKLSVNT